MDTSAPATEHRVQCPACGGQIHSVASRCKHCRMDLRAAGTRARAIPLTALPSLDVAVGPTGSNTPSTGATTGPAKAHQRDVQWAANVVALPSSEVVQRGAAAERKPWWRHWPMAVIILALLAIGYSIYLLAVPPSSLSGRSKRVNMPAHSDTDTNMDTNPLPEKIAPPPPPMPNGNPPPPAVVPFDPWSGAPDPDIDVAPSPKPLDDDSPGPTSATAFAVTLTEKLCRKLATCGNVSSSDCKIVSTIVKPLAQVQCAVNTSKAKSCFEAIDQIGCGDGDLAAMMPILQTCLGALDCDSDVQ
jgi:hypothetical protein